MSTINIQDTYFCIVPHPTYQYPYISSDDRCLKQNVFTSLHKTTARVFLKRSRKIETFHCHLLDNVLYKMILNLNAVYRANYSASYDQRFFFCIKFSNIMHKLLIYFFYYQQYLYIIHIHTVNNSHGKSKVIFPCKHNPSVLLFTFLVYPKSIFFGRNAKFLLKSFV